MADSTVKSWFTCRHNSDGEGAIAIYDYIGAFGVTAADFRNELRALGKVDSILVSINSPGGEVFDGLAIYNMLVNKPATITVQIDGLAASMASVIAMAGDVVRMPENAMLMLHQPGGVAIGTSSEMRKYADTLDTIENGLVSAYTAKTKISSEEITEMMADETWLSAAEAVDLGFADALVEPMQAAAVWDLSKFKNCPADVPGVHLDAKDIKMTSKEKQAAAEAEAKAVADAAEAKAAVDAAEAKAAVDAAEAKAAVDALAAEAKLADPVSAETARCQGLAALCTEFEAAAMLPEFIENGVDMPAALAAIKDARIAAGVELNTHGKAGTGADDEEITAGWAKATARTNSRIPGNAGVTGDEAADGWAKAINRTNSRFV